MNHNDKPRKPRALITGASSGFGREFALIFAREGWDLVLAGRDAGRLEETARAARAAGAEVSAVAADLSSPAGTRAVVAAAGDVDALVNNAGFGSGGPFAQEDPAATRGMIATNVAALVELTQALLPGIVAKKGRILNVASTGAFVACPNAAVYCATKAFVLSFTEAIATELAGTGATATALCPGASATGFARTAGLEGAKLFASAMGAREVAEAGYRAMMKGRRVRVPGLRNALLAFSVRFTPRPLAAAIAGALMG